MNGIIASTGRIWKSPAKLRECIEQSELPFCADHCGTYAVFYNVIVSCAFILPSSSSRTQLCKNIH
jgi:hypothetical protein